MSEVIINKERIPTHPLVAARIDALEAELRWHMCVGERDEWECEHGAQVSQTCFDDCHLNRTRRVLGFIKEIPK